MSVGWGTNDPDQQLSLQQIQNYWYHWFMALDRGADLIRNQRREFTSYIWREWNPGWRLPDESFEHLAESFENPDWADVVLHSYRSRWGLAALDPAYDSVEHRLRDDNRITVPTLVIHGGADPCNAPSTSEGKDGYFTADYRRIVLGGVGHFPQRQAASVVAQEILSHLSG